VIVIAGVNAQ